MLNRQLTIRRWTGTRGERHEHQKSTRTQNFGKYCFKNIPLLDFLVVAMFWRIINFSFPCNPLRQKLHYFCWLTSFYLTFWCQQCVAELYLKVPPKNRLFLFHKHYLITEIYTDLTSTFTRSRFRVQWQDNEELVRLFKGVMMAWRYNPLIREQDVTSSIPTNAACQSSDVNTTLNGKMS